MKEVNNQSYHYCVMMMRCACSCRKQLSTYMCIRFAVAPCSFSFLRMCGSEKNRLDLDVSKQYTLFVLRRDCSKPNAHPSPPPDSL